MVRVVRRIEWNARPPRTEMKSLYPPITDIFVMDVYQLRSCTDTNHCMHSMRLAQKFDMDRHAHRDIRFNFMIGGDGLIYEGRGWKFCAIVPNRYQNYMFRSIVIGIIGPVNKDEGLPDIMRKQYEGLLKYGIHNSLVIPDYEEHFLLRS